MTDEAPSRLLLSPLKPVVVFDGECALCAAWVAGLRRREGQQLECVPYQNASVPARFPNLAHQQLVRSVHLIEADGRVHSGAQAVLHTPDGGQMQAALLWLCERSPAFARFAEAAYLFIARNRRRLSTVVFWHRR